MKLLDTIIFALCVALLVIGIHQSMLHGIQHSYFFFMLSSAFFLWYTLRKKSQPDSGKPRRALMKEGPKMKKPKKS